MLYGEECPCYGRNEIIERADLEEQTVDDLLAILSANLKMKVTNKYYDKVRYAYKINSSTEKIERGNQHGG
mgnify:CR=1 FL=1